MIHSMIVAVADNGVIGHKNKLPWHLPADLRHFREITTGYPIIMGRKTFESIGRPLPNRTNIVITRNPALRTWPAGVLVSTCLNEAWDKCELMGVSESFVIGGQEIYRQALYNIDRLYLTEVHLCPDGDSRFTGYHALKWESIQSCDGEDNGVSYTFRVLDRKWMV